MLSRRASIASLAGGTTLASGCLGFLLGGEPLSVAATRAEVGQAALERTGYRHLATDPYTFTKEFTVRGQTRTVEVTNYVARYARRVETAQGLRDAAVFAALATPQVDISGQTINPLGDLPTPAIVERAQDLYRDVRITEQLGARAVRILDSPREMARFAGVATLAGTSLDVFLHLARFHNAGDVLFALGTHPRALASEAGAVARLAGAITHG